MQQCREGWHLADEPEQPVGDQDAGLADDLADQPGPDTDAGTAEGGPGCARRFRSTRRVEGFPDLPPVPMAPGTIGRTYVDPVTGNTFQIS